MGAAEALSFLETLTKYDILSTRTVAHYVLPALYGGVEICEGTAGYTALEESLYRESACTTHDSSTEDRRSFEQSVSGEAARYLRRILATAAGDRKDGLTHYAGRYDGYSRETYVEVRALLGSTGLRFLGIRNQRDGLRPPRTRVLAMLMDEALNDTETPTIQHEPSVGSYPEPPGAPPDILSEYDIPVPATDSFPPPVYRHTSLANGVVQDVDIFHRMEL